MNTCLITLDIINDICHPNGNIASFTDRIEKNHTIENINQITTSCRKHNMLITHVRLAFRNHHPDGSYVSPVFSTITNKQILKNTDWGSQFCDSLSRQESDIEIIKHRVSAFYGTDLDLILRANKIEQLILVGVATNNAVELTAREAHDRDYHVTIISDACETSDDNAQQASLNFLSRIANVTTTQLFS